MDAEDAEGEEWQPSPVEGRVPDEEEMQLKASNGRYYLQDVWKIVREFPTAHVYGPCRTDVDGLAQTLRPDASVHGYEVVDSSSRLDGVVHCMQLAIAWHQIVHEARNSKVVHVIRRTPENNGTVLMLQRQEHLRGQCTEFAPAAFIVLVGGQQVLFTRDRVLPQADTERMVLMMIKQEQPPPPAPTERTVLDEYLELEEKELEPTLAVPNMSAALFRQQINTVNELMKVMGVAAPDATEDATVADVADDFKGVALSVKASGTDGVRVELGPRKPVL